MATRKELEVGQERELVPVSTIASQARPRVKILALDQFLEVYRPNGHGYDLKEDRVLIEVVEAHGWTDASWSHQLTKKRAAVQRVGGQLMGRREEGSRFRSRRYEEDDLPKGQYLVTTRMLGPIWNEEVKAQERAEKEDHDRREAEYQAAVKHQRDLLSTILMAAGIPGTRWSGQRFALTYNDLSALLKAASANTIDIKQVHHQDFFEKDRVS